MSNPTAEMFELAKRKNAPWGAPRVLVETGTYTGKTTLLATQHFGRVETIELSERLYRAAAKLLEPMGVVCHFGDTRVILPRLCRELAEPVVWYLDAHYWREPLQAAEKNPLPLQEELTAIAARPWPDVVIVDDVHAFGRTDHKLPGWEVVTPEWICALLGRVREWQIVGDQCLAWRNAA